MKKIESIKCKECKRDLNFQNVCYTSYTTKNGKMDVCKTCVRKMNENEIIQLCAIHNIPIIKSAWDKSIEINNSFDNHIGMYFRQVFCLPQYAKLRFKDSDLIINSDTSNTVDSFNENVVKFLKQEAKMLEDKISNLLKEESDRQVNTYKNLIRAYEDVVKLVKMYDWQLKYSVYRTDDKKQISIWEQNSDNLIRDYKCWNIESVASLPDDLVSKTQSCLPDNVKMEVDDELNQCLIKKMNGK